MGDGQGAGDDALAEDTQHKVESSLVVFLAQIRKT